MCNRFEYTNVSSGLWLFDFVIIVLYGYDGLNHAEACQGPVPQSRLSGPDVCA